MNHTSRMLFIAVILAAQLQAAYRDVVMADNPVVYFRLDDASGTVAASQTNTQWNGTYENTANIDFGQPGALSNDANTSVRFNGNSFITFPTDANVVHDTADFTIEAWVRPCDNGMINVLTYRRWMYDPNYQFFINGGNQISIWCGDSGGIMDYSISYATNGSQWYHVVWTRAGDVLRAYLNGAQVGADVTNNADFDTPRADEKYRLGMAGELGYPQQIINAGADEYACYDHALSAARIKAHYEAGLGVPEPCGWLAWLAAVAACARAWRTPRSGG